jgi:non-heme chloroperoxidase
MGTITGKDGAHISIGASAMCSSPLVRNAQLKVYKGLPHGKATTHHDVINAALLTFFRA